MDFDSAFSEKPNCICPHSCLTSQVCLYKTPQECHLWHRLIQTTGISRTNLFHDQSQIVLKTQHKVSTWTSYTWAMCIGTVIAQPYKFQSWHINLKAAHTLQDLYDKDHAHLPWINQSWKSNVINIWCLLQGPEDTPKLSMCRPKCVQRRKPDPGSQFT